MFAGVPVADTLKNEPALIAAWLRNNPANAQRNKIAGDPQTRLNIQIMDS